MLCAVYKSSKKEFTFLYVNKRDDFSAVPDALMATFGAPTLVTVLNLASKSKLAFADLKKVKENLLAKGYYLQLPPPKEDLLKEHRNSMLEAKSGEV